MWLPDNTCTFDPPANSSHVVLFVAILSALIGTPIILLLNWIIHNILCSSTSSSQTKKLSFLANGSMFNLKLNPYSNSFFVVSLKEMSELSDQIKRCRAFLSKTKRKEFDGIFILLFDFLLLNLFLYIDIWGLDDDGFFITENLSKIYKQNSINVHRLVLDELNSIHANIEIEKQNLLLMQTNEARGRKLLRLFCLDLLPGLQGKILRSKISRDEFIRKNFSLEIKIISAVFVFLLNLFMVYYSFLFAIQKSNDLQNAWFITFVYGF
jgi:hypothetical protein